MTDVGNQVFVRAPAIEIARGSLLAGRYQVEAVLGRGGSGIVLRAFDRVAQVPVAVKILKPDLAADPRWIERFSRELRLARQIPHAHVCRVFDIGQADGHWFITMELATGGTLREHLGEVAKTRSFEEKVEDARAVVAGLAAIHDAGIVHRDLKPDNFLRMADGRLVLSDFGLATNPSDGSMISILVGTPSYMAPEVVLGDQSSLRSDVWSLGVVLHEIFFGVRPERPSTAIKKTGEQAPTRKLTPAERSLTWFIEECLNEEATERPADGRAAQVQFERALSSMPRAGGSRRRRPAWMWPALAAVGAVAIAAATGHWWRGATASSTAADEANPIAQLRGEATDWTNKSNVVASFDEPIHCMSWLEPDRVLEIVLGNERRALTLDVATRSIQPSTLAEGAFALGCPQRSNRGQLLFESSDEAGRRQIMLAPSAESIEGATAVTAGTQPIWFPSGREFAYTADDSHAAVFSLPVMTTTIVNERAEDAGLLTGKAIAADGSSIVLRYVDRSMRWHVVVHQLPTLSTTNRAIFDVQATDFEFLRDRQAGLVFSLSDESGAILARLDPRTNAVDRLGTVPGHILGRPTPGSATFAMMDLLVLGDVWRIENGNRTVRLTTDGQSFRPDVSVNGDLIVEQQGIAEKSSIQLRLKGAQPRTVTTGPRDYTPHFLPDGKGWLYVDGTRQTIRQCDLAGACRDIYTSRDNDLPFQPVASPDLRQIAFVTAIGRGRLKVLSNDGKVRDLGPARPECAPLWGDGNHLWVLQGAEQRLSWAKIDASTGEVAAALPIAEEARQEVHDCPILSRPPEVHPREVASWSSARSTIRLIPTQHLPPLGQKP